ncbi:MAG: hypothetical protein ACPHTD_06770, partial [Gammaproteobacteria bacterium]
GPRPATYQASAVRIATSIETPRSEALLKNAGDRLSSPNVPAEFTSALRNRGPLENLRSHPSAEYQLR